MPSLGEYLIKHEFVTQTQLEEALTSQKSSGKGLVSCLLRLGYVSDDVISRILATEYGIPPIDLANREASPDLVSLVPRHIAVKYQVIPIARNGRKLVTAMVDPTNIFVINEMSFLTGLNVDPVVASASQIEAAIERFYPTEHAIELGKVYKNLGHEASVDPNSVELVAETDELVDVHSLESAAEQAPIVTLVNLILDDAVKRGASDIHLEPFEREFVVRMRVDGVLQRVMTPPIRFKDPITSRIKIMAKLDIAEKRLPQDGRIKIAMKIEDKRKELDLRVSTVPSLFGEKVAIRLLRKENLMLDMRHLGFEASSLERFERAVAQPFGMILVTGPTGSGKTSTLYSAISKLNLPDRHILTAEDPVEFAIPGINQVQTKEQIGLTFAAALHSFLRQDPNIILVGEIRDLETAEIASKAAMTGHLVLSTLHTNDGPSTIVRLSDMGVEPFMLATSLQLICAQRLVRRVCAACMEPFRYPERALLDIGFAAEDIPYLNTVRGTGCQKCSGTGYRGRIGLYEILEISDEIREMIVNRASVTRLRDQAVREGMITIRQSGLTKIRDGITTIEEVLRETVG